MSTQATVKRPGPSTFPQGGQQPGRSPGRRVRQLASPAPRVGATLGGIGRDAMTHVTIHLPPDDVAALAGTSRGVRETVMSYRLNASLVDAWGRTATRLMLVSWDRFDPNAHSRFVSAMRPVAQADAARRFQPVPPVTDSARIEALEAVDAFILRMPRPTSLPAPGGESLLEIAPAMRTATWPIGNPGIILRGSFSSRLAGECAGLAPGSPAPRP